MKQFWRVVGLIVIIYILNTRSIPIDSNCEGSTCCGTGFQPCLIVAKRQVEPDPNASALQGNTDESGNLVNNGGSTPTQNDGNNSNQQVSQETVPDPSQGAINMNGDPSAQAENSMNPTNNAPSESAQNNDAASQSSQVPADSAQNNDAASQSSQVPADSAQNNDAASQSSQVPADSAQNNDAASQSSQVPADSAQNNDAASQSSQVPADSAQNNDAASQSSQVPADSAQTSNTAVKSATGNSESSTESDATTSSQGNEVPAEAAPSDSAAVSQNMEAPTLSSDLESISQDSETSVDSAQPIGSANTSPTMDVPTQSSDTASTSQSNETPVDSTQTNTAVNSQPSNGMAGGSETSAESPQSSDIAANSQSSEAPAQTTPSSETLPISGSSEVSGETPQASEVTGESGTGINQEPEVSTSQPSDTTSQSSETSAVPPLTVSESNQASADSSQTSEGIVPSETIETPAVTSQSGNDTPIATETNEEPAESSPSDVAVSSQTSETSSESTSSNSGTVSEPQSQSSTTSDESTTVPQSSESPVEPLQTTEAPKNSEGSTDPAQANNESGNAAATPLDSTSNDIVPALTGEGQESGATSADSTHTESQTGETSVEQGHITETSAASQTPEATFATIEESQKANNNQENNADLPNTATAVNEATTPASDAVPETTATETSTIEDKTSSTEPIESGVTEIPLVSSSPSTIAEPTSTSAATTQESTKEPFSSSTSSTPETKPLIASNSSFDVVTNTRHHFESYDDLVAKLNQTFEKSYIEITQALSELLKNETVFTNSTASDSTTLSPPTTPTTGRPTVTPKPAIMAQNSSDGETPLYPDSVDTSLSDLSAPSYSSQEPLEPEDESLFGTTTPKYNSDVFLRGETSPGCLMEDRESFKRNAYSTVYSMTDGRPTMLSFLERETCVGTLSKTGRRTVRSRGILLPQLPLRLKIEAGMYIQNRLYLFDSSPAQKVWSFTYENSTRIYSLKSHSVISVDAFLQVCDILSHPPNFRVKAIAQFSLTDPTCIVYDKMGTPLLSANPSEEAVSLVNAIRYLMEREFVSQINSIFSWLDDSFVKSVYLYGTNGELYELYRDATSHNLWPMGKYRLIPYEDFPIPNNGMVSGNF